MSIDVGGTFTDLCVLDEQTGRRSYHKSLTTYDDLTKGVLAVIRLAADDEELGLSNMLNLTSRIVHGTTVATNALIEGKKSKVGAMITKGFRDTLYLRTGEGRTNPYDFHVDYPDPFVPRYLTFPIEERINAEGGVQTILNEGDVRKAIGIMRKYKVDAIAVLFLWSIANHAHERRVREIVNELLPEVPVFLSHEVNPILREYQRFISTAIDASLYRLVKDYTLKLEAALKAGGFHGQLFMMTSTGGVVGAREMAEHPILIVDSGPSMMPVAGLAIARQEVKSQTYICVDMGGTSFDVSYVRDGEILTTWDSMVGSDNLGISKVDVESIGAGGGSIAWVDSGRLLHVGPKSAGSEPGPACYGKGGKLPTVTDSNLVLGYLSPTSFFGGKWQLSKDLASEAIQRHIGDRLGTDAIHAAHLINNVVNTNMLSAIRELGIRRGVDPASQILVSGGAAAGLHALSIARALRMKNIIIPRCAGVLSAYGGIEANIQRDFTRSYYCETNTIDYPALKRVLRGLEDQAAQFLKRSKIPKRRQSIAFSTEARYPFQVHELEVPLSSGRMSPELIKKLIEDFHETHERVYNTRSPAQYLECVNWKAKAIGRTINKAEVEWQAGGDISDAEKGEREAWFDPDEGSTWTKVYDGSKLGYGTLIPGPAIIEELTTTILLHPGDNAAVTRSGNYFVRLE
ncbi:MAG: hydantoinase/oxoprolinase family protein [Thaumarchaeota archaeon]|nr:hydantoinase/oxoprolinase family protein [Nitrososphaerota archaeon]